MHLQNILSLLCIVFPNAARSRAPQHRQGRGSQRSGVRESVLDGLRSHAVYHGSFCHRQPRRPRPVESKVRRKEKGLASLCVSKKLNVFASSDIQLLLPSYKINSLGFLGVISFGYAVHAYDRYLHRREIGRVRNLKRTSSQSAARLKAMGIPVEEQLQAINDALASIDQVYIPSTINNMINTRYIMEKEREIISVFQEAEENVSALFLPFARFHLCGSFDRF